MFLRKVGIYLQDSHGVTTKKINIDIFTAMKTSNSIFPYLLVCMCTCLGKASLRSALSFPKSSVTLENCLRLISSPWGVVGVRIGFR
jgi:hypothetical protein